MRRVLVLRGGALGDFIVTLPALCALRRRWPEARIELAGNATAARLAMARGWIDAVHSQHEARWSALWNEGALPAEFHAWLGGFDLVVNYWPDPDGALARRFPVHAGQTFLSAAAMPETSPAAAHYAGALRPLGLVVTEFSVRLDPLAAVNSSVADGVMLLHPGSGSPRKNWPAENWRALIDRLDGPKVVLLGEAEHGTWADFAAAPPPNVRVWASPTLEEIVAAAARCDVFVGHDSGVSHLAAASGARCVLLFGPTEPERWAPPVPNVQVLRRDSNLAALAVSDVVTAVAAARQDRT